MFAIDSFVGFFELPIITSPTQNVVEVFNIQYIRIYLFFCFGKYTVPCVTVNPSSFPSYGII